MPVIPEITLLRELARGGMGIVYRGRQDFLEREVAVKLLAPHLQGERFGARFRREAKLLAGIKHPHIVACYAAGVTPAGQHYLVMELVEGPNLETWIAQNGPVPVRAALRITGQLAAALGHASELGVIHRDIKCANILLEETGGTSLDPLFPFAPKLVDLGLARMVAAGTDPTQTAPGAVMGTPTTMAPEQFDAPDTVDFRADIYGLGCVLYEMLTGAPAFPSLRLTELVVQKRMARGPNPCAQVATIPNAVGELVASMLAHDPSDRPTDYRSLRMRLDALAKAPSEPRQSPADERTSRGTAPAGGLLRTTEFEFLAAGHGAMPHGAAFESRVHEPGDALRADAATVPSGLRPIAASEPTNQRTNGARELAPVCTPASGRKSARIAPFDPHPAPPRVVGARIVASVPLRRRTRRRWPVAAALPLLLLAAVPWLRDHGAPPASPTHTQPHDGARTILATGPTHASPGPAPSRAPVPTDSRPAIDLLADILTADGPWQSNGSAKATWRQRDGGALVVVAGEQPTLHTRSLVGTTWQLSGTFVPEHRDGLAHEPFEVRATEPHLPPRGPDRRGRDPRGFGPHGAELRPSQHPGEARGAGNAAFAQAGITFRVDARRQLALVCTRSGGNGEHWALALHELVHEGSANDLALRPLATSTRTRVDATGAALPRFVVTRHGDELQVEFGFDGRSERASHREPLPAGTEALPLSLLARAGRVVFPELSLR